MSRKTVEKSIPILVALIAMILLLALQHSAQVSADPPLLSTPAPETMTQLRFDPDEADGETAGVPPAAPVSVAPAAIDATAVITAFADTEIIQGYPAANCADSLEMRAGYDICLDPDGQIVRSLVRFSLAGIPSEATIQSASLWLFLGGSYGYTGQSIPITPYRISSPWVVDTVTWNSAPSHAESYPATWITHGVWGWYSFDVTDLVSAWADGTYHNYGILLRGTETSARWRAFFTSETIYPPQLVIAYAYEPGFDLTIVPDEQSVLTGQSTTSVVYLTARGGFSDSVALDVDGLPAGATCEWGTNPGTPTTSTALTITTAAATPPGDYALTLTGTGDDQVRTVQITLHVSGTAVPDFDLSLTPSQQSIPAGEKVLYTAHLTATGGFSDSVTLDVGGLPANTTCQWSANPVTPTASTILTVTTTADTPLGTHTFTVTGTGGGIVHSDQATLITTISRTVYLPAVLRNYPVAGLNANAGQENSQPAISATGSPVSRIALIIGVTDYEHMAPAAGARAGAPGYDPTYPVADAYDTGDILLTRGTIGAANLTLLLDAQATKAAIHAAIVNWLAPLEDENTVVVISFSGHGMYAPDDNGDENDAYDEFLVPYEIEWRPAEGWLYQMAISDDELESWLSVLESQHIAILIDSCFSGGMIETSSQELDQTRGLSWQPASQGQVTAGQWQDGFVQDIQGTGRVVLTASAEDQPSWEFGELQNGAFTYYLIQALRSQGADKNGNGWVSAEEAYAYLVEEVDDYVYAQTGSHQNPQISDGVSGEVDLAQLGQAVEPCPLWP